MSSPLSKKPKMSYDSEPEAPSESKKLSESNTQLEAEIPPNSENLSESNTISESNIPPNSENQSETNPIPESDTTTPKPPRYKRRKVAIFLAYCGHGYQGMQKNPGARTIESDLELALYLAKAVPESDKCCPNRYEWARAARTDKGVSAAGQVVSGRFFVDPPGFVDRLHENLDKRIRVFGYTRVTNSFSAKKFCDRRRYVYLLPVFALDTAKHMDRESVLKSFGSDIVLAKCVECSERGRKVLGVMGNRRNNGERMEESNEENKHTVFKEKEEETEASNMNGDMSNETEVIVGEKSNFEYGMKEKARFNAILKRYEGTHNFHNFTTRTKAEDPAAKRYIISFNADTTVTIDGLEFVRCEVVGQSFMLHQIRKMIGFAVAMMRNCCPESLMDTALRPDININVPTAPEVGLYLDECFFTSYNDKWKDTHEKVSMESYAEQAEEFKMKYIFSHIASMEHKEGAVALWLHSLNQRNYSDFLFHEKNGASVHIAAEEPLESSDGLVKPEQRQEISGESVKPVQAL